MKLFRSSLAKKILGIVLVIGCSNIFFNGNAGVNEAHAQGIAAEGSVITNGTTSTNTSSSINTMGIREILNMILKIIYLLLRPLLVIAGISLDNTLVYASVFHLDAPLRKFRNMMKNFANFALGFMVLFAIIKSLFTGSGEGSFKDEKSPLGIIKKTLIAGVFIQASRFIMAALVDVSTIATYAVGGLPLSVLKNTDIGKQKILSVNSSIDLNNFDILNKNAESFKVRYSTTYKGKTIKISPCRIEDSFVIGREFGDPEFRNIEKFIGDPTYAGYEVCALNGNQLIMRKEDQFFQSLCDNILCVDTGTAAGYNAGMDALLNYSGRETLSRVTGTLVNLNNQTAGLSMGNSFFADSSSITISQLIDKSKGFVGPLVTMYSSLLNFAQLTDANVTTLGETSGIFIIKAGIAIALFFPLLALAVVLIARVALLRLFIVASPFIVIKESFKDFLKLGKIDEYLNFKSVLGIIFAPVITVAALSISLIFMTALINGFKSGDNQHISSQVAENLGASSIPAIETGNQAFLVAGVSELEFKNFDRGGSLDRFSRLIVNFFAIGLLRTILFAAIKANALGKSLGAPIQSFGSNIFQTLPVIPFGPNGERVGIGSAITGTTQVPQERAESRQQEQIGNVRALFEAQNPTNKSTTTPPTLTSAQIEGTINALKNPPAGQTAEQSVSGYFTEQKVNIVPTAIGTGNGEAIFNAINAVSNPEERQNLVTNANSVFGTDFYKTYTIEDIKKAIVISNETKQEEIGGILSKPEAKKALDDYFTYADKNASDYTITSPDGKQTLKISKNTGADQPTKPYIGTLSSTESPDKK